jgi:hypothetical protein
MMILSRLGSLQPPTEPVETYSRPIATPLQPWLASRVCKVPFVTMLCRSADAAVAAVASA